MSLESRLSALEKRADALPGLSPEFELRPPPLRLPVQDERFQDARFPGGGMFWPKSLPWSTLWGPDIDDRYPAEKELSCSP